MNLTTQNLRDIAERLIAYDVGINKSSETKTPVVCLACENLRTHLVTFMGNVGFNALFSRALALASAEVTWLRAINVNAEGALQGWEELGAQINANEISEGCVVLLVQVIGLLVAFIGEDLTLRFVGEAWPKLTLNDLDFGKGL